MGAHLTVEARSAQRNRSAHDHDRAMRESNYLLRDAPEKQPGEPAMAAAADDDHISPSIPGCCNDFPGRVSERRFSRDPRDALCLRLPASANKSVIGRRKDEFGRGYLFHPCVFRDRRLGFRRR